MDKTYGNSEKSIDPFQPIADLLYNYLHDIIYSPANAHLDIESLPKSFNNLGRGLQYLNNSIQEIRAFSKELSVGNLSCAPPSSANEIVSSLKMLQSSLRHLTWQTQQIAKGDYNQRVDFMGDFSKAFNYMTEKLDQRQQISHEEKIKLEIYVQLILANTPNPLLLFDKNGKLVYASNSFFNYYKFSEKDEVVGKTVSEILNSIEVEGSLEKILILYETAVLENKTKEIEQKIGSVYFKIQITPMLSANEVFMGVMIFLIDITESVLARREAENARKLAEQSSHSKTIFLAKMSHEIRTPMNAIIGMTELALRENIPPTAMEQIITIKHAGINLLSIINDILDFSKIETGKLEIIPDYYSIASLINDVVSIIKMRVMDTHLHFVVNLDNNIPAMLMGDEARIRQILLNILNNAVKYTKEGFVSLVIAGEKINDNRINLIFKVMDSGIGIKKKNIDKLFNEFVQFESGKSRYIEGTGLGLAITRNLIKAMNGEINVQSEYGKGSLFTITIPQEFHTNKKLAAVENPENKKALVYEYREIYANSIIHTIDSLNVNCEIVATDTDFFQKLEKSSYSFIFISQELFEIVKERLQKFAKNSTVVLLAEFGEAVSDTSLHVITMPVHSISIANILNGISDNFSYSSNFEYAVRFTAPNANVLVVDDINTNLKVVEGLLLPYKMIVDICKSGVMAIDMVKTKRYDIVLMDHMMPEMDGIEATARIRAMGEKDPYYKKLPIVALTANAVSGTKEMFYENGFDDFLPKPIDTIELNTILERWIPREKQEGSSGIIRGGTMVNKKESLIVGGLNITKGLAMNSGSTRGYAKTLEMFKKDAKEKINEIKNCLEKDDLSLYTIYVHALKGACGSIGADELSESAKALEMAGKKGDKSYIEMQTPVFIEELKKILAKIDGIIKEYIPQETQEINNTADMEALRTELLELKEALDSLNSVIIKKAVNKLLNYTKVPDTGEVVENILENILIGEYDEAKNLINSLL